MCGINSISPCSVPVWTVFVAIEIIIMEKLCILKFLTDRKHIYDTM